MRKFWIVGFFVFFGGCANTSSNNTDALADLSEKACSNPKLDEDTDGILNGEEACTTGRDSDLDGVPDWKDFDSDNDGILDSVEKGEKGKCLGDSKDTWPCDTDSDGIADFIDIDSDSDGVLDKYEDTNGDGQLGCCLKECNAPDEQWQKENCILNSQGCGSGQECESEQCTPTIGFECSNGETNSLATHTFSDGKIDSSRGNFICRETTEENPEGRKPVQTFTNTDGDWAVALAMAADYSELTITDAKTNMAAALIDDAQAEVASFVLSRDTANSDIQTDFNEMISMLNTNTPGGIGTVTIRGSGVERLTHDKFQGIHGTTLDISLSSEMVKVPKVRNELLAALLGKKITDLGGLPEVYGAANGEFVVKLVTVRRFDRDNPDDSSKWRILVMGGVAAKSNYENLIKLTRMVLDDFANGTGLATSSDEVMNECDVGIVGGVPIADIIWVIDESGSMLDNRQDIVDHANNFFSRALASGLDFRMGVTNVCQPLGTYGYAVGKFCSKISTDEKDDGGQDRFLLSSEQDIFSSCVKNPPGYEGGAEYGLVNARDAVLNHLPRATDDLKKIRKDATLVIIIVTDEVPFELYSIVGDVRYDCVLPQDILSQVNLNIQSLVDLFTGVTDSEAASVFHVIGGVCKNTCMADVAHGYRELAQVLGGQIGDVCQKDVGNTLQLIIDDIIGSASPVVLEYIPISSSLAVALDGQKIERSQTKGFDYRVGANSIVFINEEFDESTSVVVSYKRWKKQEIID